MHAQRIAACLGCLCLIILTELNAQAHSIRQHAGVYSDNQGVQSQRLQLELGLEFQHEQGWFRDSQFSVAAYRDQLSNPHLENDPYSQEVYGTGIRVAELAAIGVTAALDQRTAISAQTLYGQDGNQTTQGVTFGANRWYFSDSLQLGLEGSLQESKRPAYAVLGEDRDFVIPPTRWQQQSMALNARHLARATTMLLYSYRFTESNDRPPVHGARIELREYLPRWSAAVHSSLARFDNTGAVTNQSPLGELQAWLWDIAWLQSFNEHWRGKLSYRQYREDETTRVWREQYFLGTDAIQLGSSIEIPHFRSHEAARPVALDMQWTHYRSNEIDDSGRKVAANMYEVGLQTQF